MVELQFQYHSGHFEWENSGNTIVCLNCDRTGKHEGGVGYTPVTTWFTRPCRKYWETACLVHASHDKR